MNPYRALTMIWGKRLSLESLTRALNQSLAYPNQIPTPQAINILLNPSDFNLLYEDYPYLERQLSAYLAEYWREKGAAWGTNPPVQIYVDETLGRGKIEISLATEARIRTEPLDSTDDYGGEAPLNTYLFYQGRVLMALTQALINIGRRIDNHLVFDDPRVSRQHCQLRLRHGGYIVYDLQSTHGLFVNGERVNECHLQNGDTISLGGLQLLYIQDHLGDTQP